MKSMKTRLSALLVAVSLGCPGSAPAQSLTDGKLTEIRFDQKLGSQISPDLPFRDESGRFVRLGDYFGRKPIVLVLGYYECPMLCTLELNGLVESMEEMKWKVGGEFDVVNVSISPAETPALAAAKKASYLRRYGRSGAAAGWHFLTGDEPEIRRLADEAGFRYAYDPTVKQFAHPSGLVILTPHGKISQYLFGVNFEPKDLYSALAGASAQNVGSPIRQLVLLCFCYSPIRGKYGVLIMTVIRILGGVTLVGLAWMFAAMIRRESKAKHSAATAPHPVGADKPAGVT